VLGWLFQLMGKNAPLVENFYNLVKLDESPLRHKLQ
jgi:hypothetical protein